MIDEFVGIKHGQKLVSLLMIGVMLSGCAATSTEATYVKAQPSATPVRNETNFTKSLRCLDDMFLVRHFNYGIPISSIGVPDKTGKVFAGTRDMVISAVLNMSLRSGAFRYYDNDETLSEVAGFPHPLQGGLFIGGSISQLDQAVTTENTGAGATVGSAFGLGGSTQNMASTMSVDLHLGDVSNRMVLPGTSISNTLAIGLRSKGADFDARVSSIGLDYSINMTEQEGTHASLRALIELSMIEMLGRYAKVPYWQCLGIAGTDPRARKVAYDQYAGMRDDQRATFVASALSSNGYYNGTTPTSLTPNLRAAVARYEQENNQPALGIITFELYYALLNGPAPALAPQQDAPSTPQSAPMQPAPSFVPNITPQRVAAHGAPAPAVPPERPKGPWVSLSRESSGMTTAYKGESIRFTASLGRDGYMDCFYQDGDSKVFRVFPNPTQPSEFVLADRKVMLPGAGDYFRIVPSTVGAIEYFSCFASARPLLKDLPKELSTPVFLPLPVANMDGLARQFIQIFGKDLYGQQNSYSVLPGVP